MLFGIMLYKYIGYLMEAVLFILVLPYFLRFINKKLRNKKLTALQKLLRKFHRPLGFLMLILPPIHSYLIFKTFRIHSGTYVYLAIILTGFFGYLFHTKKKRNFLVLHKAFVVITALLLSNHVIFKLF